MTLCGTGRVRMYTGFDFGKTEIFLQTGLDTSKFGKPSDLPVGQNQFDPVTVIASNTSRKWALTTGRLKLTPRRSAVAPAVDWQDRRPIARNALWRPAPIFPSPAR